MGRIALLSWRLPLAVIAIGAVIAGLVFVATRDAGPSNDAAPIQATAGDVSAPAASAAARPSPGGTEPPTPTERLQAPASAEASPADTAAAAGASPAPSDVASATSDDSQPRGASTQTATATATATPGQAATAPPTEAPSPEPPSPEPSPVSDIPAYRDTAVLALAASAMLPGGHTFRQCVESAPEGLRWPLPVHLYYLGRGEWLVETHVSEVAVVFTEATATFRVSAYNPVGPDC